MVALARHHHLGRRVGKIGDDAAGLQVAAGRDHKLSRIMDPLHRLAAAMRAQTLYGRWLGHRNQGAARLRLVCRVAATNGALETNLLAELRRRRLLAAQQSYGAIVGLRAERLASTAEIMISMHVARC
jgi:hypothetical protein